MKVTIDLGKLLDYYDEHSHSYNLSDDNGFRAFMMDFLVWFEDKKERKDDYCLEDKPYVREIQFSSKESAKKVLADTHRKLTENGFVTVADYYISANQRLDPSCFNWGWKDIRSAYVYHYNKRDHHVWAIYLPDPLYISRNY